MSLKKSSIGHLDIKDTTHLGIDCLEIQVHHESGEMVEEDVNCDSQFMLDNIHKVGKAMREKFYWVPHPHKCYLVMDNAGGHGTEKAIKKYTDILKTEFHTEIIHQVPRSPETNVLDLGIWCSLQWAVDTLMRGKRGDMEAQVQGGAAVWDGVGLIAAFGNVWNHLGRVLHLIEEDKGSNELVEKNTESIGPLWMSSRLLLQLRLLLPQLLRLPWLLLPLPLVLVVHMWRKQKRLLIYWMMMMKTKCSCSIV
jgi:hypothetical protein